MDKELVLEWFKFANMDLDIAKNSLETMYPPPLEIICYHCQQSAEKFLKGLIIFFNEEPEKTHDLSKLLNTLQKFTSVPSEYRQAALSLTLYGIQTRYPSSISVDEQTTKNAIAHAEKIRFWAEEIFNKK